MEPLNLLTKESILEEKIFTEIFDQEDETYKARLIISLEDRAEELGVKTKFTRLLNAYKRAARELQKRKTKESPCMLDNWTNFEGPYDRMRCGSWVAGESGIYLQNVGTTDVLACYHPIIPVERLKNLETGDEQLKLAYKRNHKWQELIVPKDLVSTASKITALSKRGVSVTSENAKFLVRYLADVENFNEDVIDVQFSTSKLGWIAGDFIPYDTHIVFDADSRFKQVYEAVGEHGNGDIWLDYVRKLRQTGRMEILMLLAASFASVLVSMLGGLPFMVDLWGETEGGKTVTLMLAASVWADPDESRFIGDFKTTDVALEARADLLNHLPMILDDTSKVSRKIAENFEGIVYDLCSGKGKSRSNKDLGINRENRWRNCILTNGERPLNSYVSQGGAMNRILEVECGQDVYEDPRGAVEIFKKHYGHAGKRFVDIVRDMGEDETRAIQNDFLQLLNADEKMKKQSISLSIILTADKIATDHIFKDGCYISLDAARECLIDRNELSDNERCYQYILGEIAINQAKFDPLNEYGELWGVIIKDSVKGDTAAILSNAFDNILDKKGFSRRSFLSWAGKKGLIETQAGKPTKAKKINGKTCKCIFLKMENLQEEDTNFQEMYDQEELPFT